MSQPDPWLLCDPYCAQFKCYHEEETEMNPTNIEPVTEAELARMAAEICPCDDPECSLNVASRLARELAAARAAMREREEERDKLQAFKDWVHGYLDKHGVPHHPPGMHGAEGCRIGDRMDWVMAQIEAARQPIEDALIIKARGAGYL